MFIVYSIKHTIPADLSALVVWLGVTTVCIANQNSSVVAHSSNPSSLSVVALMAIFFQGFLTDERKGV